MYGEGDTNHGHDDRDHERDERPDQHPAQAGVWWLGLAVVLVRHTYLL